MAKRILYGDTARKALNNGLESLTNTIRVTLGPKGRNVVVDKSGDRPLITNDGVTIANEVSLPDPYENLGIAVVKEAAAKTNDSVGDGTTTATVLAETIVKNGQTAISSGASPVLLNKGIESAVSTAVNAIGQSAREVKTEKDIAAVASISADDYEIGRLIAQTMEQVTMDGYITVEESNTADTYSDIVAGVQFEQGYISSYMMQPDAKAEKALDDAYLLVTDKSVSSAHDILPLLEEVASSGHGLVVIAQDVSGEALATLSLNALRGTIPCVAVKAPGYGDNQRSMLADIAVFTGAQIISEELGLELGGTTLAQLGRAKRVLVTKDTTTITGGQGEIAAIEARVLQVRCELENATSAYERETLHKRLAKLSGGIGVIRVGAETQVERLEKKQRVEDALAAATAAREEGIVAGGGVALLRAAGVVRKTMNKYRGDKRRGVELVADALERPVRQILDNAGLDSAKIVDILIHADNPQYGYDAYNGRFCDMLEMGIVDPAKVTRVALQCAASIAQMLLTTEAVVAEAEESPSCCQGDCHS